MSDGLDDMPTLVSDAGSDSELTSSSSDEGARRAIPAGGTAFGQPANVFGQPAAAGGSGWARSFGSGLDEIDRSDSDYLEGAGALDGWGDEDIDGGGLLHGGAAGLLGGFLPQASGGFDDRLLQQLPLQGLLEALLNSGQAGPLADLLEGGPGGMQVLTGPYGLPAGRAHLSGVESRIPAGLQGADRRHAVSMAEQGFVSALDPARHAACAAEGVPGGRHRVASPRSPQGRSLSPNRPAAAAAAAGGQQRQQQQGGGLHRVDSALHGGGLQRGDSAGSQGSGRAGRGPGGGAPQGPSRLAGAARSGAAPGPAAPAAGSPPGLTSSASSDDDGDVPGRNAPGSQAHGSGQQPAARPRRRRNAVFGRLPGIAPGLAGTAGAAGGSGRASPPMPGLTGSSESDSEEGTEDHGLARNARRQRQLRLQRQEQEQEQGGGGSQAAAAYASSTASGGAPQPPGLVSDSGGSSHPGLTGSDGGGSGAQLALFYSGASSEDDIEGFPFPELLSDASSSSDGRSSDDSGPLRRPLRRGAQQQQQQQQQRAPASADQQAVMQALSSLLPQQGDAAGWADLAAYVRHASGSGQPSRGGVQLLSRLVASAASRFPAEAEAAGLTERPLAPPPSVAPTAPGTAAGSPTAVTVAASRAAAAAAVAAAVRGDGRSGAAAAAAEQPAGASAPDAQAPGAAGGGHSEPEAAGDSAASLVGMLAAARGQERLGGSHLG